MSTPIAYGSGFSSERSPITVWDYKTTQHNSYQAVLTHFESYMEARYSKNNLAIHRARFVSEMNVFLMTVQHMFFSYLASVVYTKDVEKNKWNEKLNANSYIDLIRDTTIQTAAPVTNDDKIFLMFWVLNNWAQEHGCFKMYTEGIKFDSVASQIDLENQ